MHRLLVVGAGFSGAVVARKLAEAGYSCLVVEERDHVAGNCHTSEDRATGILVHRYGPHIFHTDDPEIWEFVQRFGNWEPYKHTVFATVKGRVFSLPMNLLTIKQFFQKAMGPEEARKFIEKRVVKYGPPVNFRQQALSMVGEELFEAFFHSYTVKQWGVPVDDLPASIIKRLPLRFSYDTNYFHHRQQAMPRDGYTAIVNAILTHERIEVRLNAPMGGECETFHHVFYTGGIDRFFDYRLGRLRYRTLRFEDSRAPGDVLGCPVMNYPDADVPWTRATEHQHLSPWRKNESGITIVSKEFASDAGPGEPLFYPLRTLYDKEVLRQYIDHAKRQSAVTFLGRLGSYSYIDMDAAVRRAIDTASIAATAFASGKKPPAFAHDPLNSA